jgi:phosphoheptose isomerase
MFGKPAFPVVLLSLFVHCINAASNDAFYEELFIKSLEKGNVLNHFQFTTIWNSSISEEETCELDLKDSLKNIFQQ